VRRSGRGVVQEELPVLLEIGMEGQAEQPFFVLVVVINDLVIDVDQALWLPRRWRRWKNQHGAIFRNDGQASCAVGRIRKINWPLELQVWKRPFDFHIGDRLAADWNGAAFGRGIGGAGVRERRERSEQRSGSGEELGRALRGSDHEELVVVALKRKASKE